MVRNFQFLGKLASVKMNAYTLDTVAIDLLDEALELNRDFQEAVS